MIRMFWNQNLLVKICIFFVVTTSTFFSLSFASSKLEWISLGSETPVSLEVKVLKADEVSTLVLFKIGGVFKENIKIGNKKYTRLLLPGASRLDKKGFPELPKSNTNLVIPASANKATFNIHILKSEEKDLGVIVPSKGSFTREINPANVPYVFSEFYSGYLVINLF